MTHFVNLVNATGAEKLKIRKPFDLLLGFHREEDEALKKIFKSAMTAEIHAADTERDETFRGMAEANLSALRHFKPAVRKAAQRLQIVFDTYGNVARKSDEEETSAIHNLLSELMQKHEADMELVGLNPWAEELYMQNGGVEKMLEERDRESAARTDLVMKQARARVDEAYRAVTGRIDALAVVAADGLLDDGDTSLAAAYADFIANLNITIDRFNARIAQRRGMAKAKKEEEATKPKPDAPAE